MTEKHLAYFHIQSYHILADLLEYGEVLLNKISLNGM